MIKNLFKYMLIFLILFISVFTVFARGQKKVEKVSINIILNYESVEHNSIDVLIEEYLHNNPDIEIIYTYNNTDNYKIFLKNNLDSKNNTDIVFLSGDWIYEFKDYLEIVPSDILNTEQSKELYYSSAIDAYIVDDKLYGLPLENNIYFGCIAVNMNHVAENDVNTDWQTWEELIIDSQKIANIIDGEIKRAGLGILHYPALTYTYLSLMNQFGQSLIKNDQYQFDSPESVQAMELLKIAVQSGAIDAENEYNTESFLNEEVSMMIIPPEELLDSNLAEMDIQYFKLPGVSNSNDIISASAWGFCVNKNSKNKDFAFDLIRFIAVESENVNTWNSGTNTLPALKNYKVNYESEYFNTYLEILENAEYHKININLEYILKDIIYSNLILFLKDEISLEEAVENMQNQADIIN